MNTVQTQSTLASSEPATVASPHGHDCPVALLPATSGCSPSVAAPGPSPESPTDEVTPSTDLHSAISGPVSAVPGCSASPSSDRELPPFEPSAEPAFVWGILDSSTFIASLNSTYKEVVDWNLICSKSLMAT